MKKVLLVLCTCAFLFSCEDGGGIGGSKEFCFACTTTYTTSGSGIPTQTHTTRIENCDWTEEEARNYEKTGSTSTVSSVGYTATTRAVTSCQKR